MSALAQIEQHLVKTLLSPVAATQYSKGDVAKRELAPFLDSLHAISSAYISHESGQRLESPVESLTAATAYALYYTPINAAKIEHCVKHMRLEAISAHQTGGTQTAANRAPLRVLDLGSGPGTVGLALLAALNVPISLTCIERSSPMRTVAHKLLSSFPAKQPLVELEISETLNGISPSSFDIVLAANVFAELANDIADSSLDTLAKALRPSGHLILLEPGQPHHTRRLMALRDKIITNHSHLTPIYPCLRSGPCPMLQASSSDWCHGTLEWQQPPLHRQLDRLLGFNKHRIKFACFIFQEGAPLGQGVRVLTPPEKTRAGVEALLCGAQKYGIGRIPKRLRSANTKAFEKAKVFDHLVCVPEFIGDAPEDIILKIAN
ncbi:MAG: small ribosomal subunit Rsm22 family protein [Pseudomonadota bacterium]|jgi:predicted O-methyltransferase YrrM